MTSGAAAKRWGPSCPLSSRSERRVREGSPATTTVYVSEQASSGRVAPCSAVALVRQRSVLAGEQVPAFGALAAGEVHVRILGRVGGIAVADLEITGRDGAPVDQLMTVACSGGKACAHPGGQHLLAGVGPQDHLALQHEDELVLLGVEVPHGRLFPRKQRAQIDADLRQAQGVPKGVFLVRLLVRLFGLVVAGRVVRVFGV